MEITKIWQKPRGFWFADFFSQEFKIHRLVWIFQRIFGCLKSISSMLRSKLKLILNFTNTVLSKKIFGSVYSIIRCCLVYATEIHRVGTMDLKIRFSFLCGLSKYTDCAAKAFCYCPAIISHRPRSQNTSKEPQLNPEKDS